MTYIPPSKVLIYLGFEVNINANTISITKSKIDTVLDEYLCIYGQKRINRHTIQSLVGKLLYVHKCVHPARMFENRILYLFRKNSHKKYIQLDENFKKDLLLFIKFLPSYNGIIFFQKESLEENKTLCIDASLTRMGGGGGGVGVGKSILLFFLNNVLLKQSGKINKDYHKPSRRKNYLQKNMNR